MVAGGGARLGEREPPDGRITNDVAKGCALEGREKGAGILRSPFHS